MKKLFTILIIITFSSINLYCQGVLYGWGHASEGRLGTGYTGDYVVPTQLNIYNNFSNVDCKVKHTAVIKADGTLMMAGRNYYGQIGNGSTLTTPVPSFVQIGSSTWISIACGLDHTAGIQSDKTLWTWGRNNCGQLGDDGETCVGSSCKRTTPLQISEDTDWIKVACGDYYTIALKLDGTLWACGLNNYGQLGIGSNTSYNYLVQIGEDTDWSDISCGEVHTLALKSNGSLWSWGRNNCGQLGDGSTNSKLIPSQIGTSFSWIKISCGDGHSLAIRSDGTLWACGLNGYGRLGIGNNYDQSNLVQVAVVTTWLDIQGGSEHTIAIKSDRTLWAWGRNNYGQLGNNNKPTSEYSPIQISSEPYWISIAAGDVYSLAIFDMLVTTLLSPINNSIEIPTNTSLSWNPSLNATSYTLQVSDDPYFTTFFVNESNLTSTNYSISNLDNGTTYYWRVLASNSTLTGLWTSAWHFTTTENQSPIDVPSLISPENNALDNEINTLLEWEEVSNATSYTLQLSLTEDFSDLILNESGIEATEFQLTDLEYITTYFWRVNATDGTNTSDWSEVWSFTTEENILPPQLISPLNNSTNIPVNPYCIWQEVQNAESYVLQVSENAVFSSFIINLEDITDLNYQLTNLDNSTQYFWRVQAVNTNQTSDWSEVWSFTTDSGVIQECGWTLVEPLPQSNDLWNVQYVNDSVAYAVGNEGTIIKTTNSGITWSAQTSGTAIRLIGLHFISATTGWAVGLNGTIIKTTNGGNTWISQSSGVSTNLNSIYFISATTGWVVGYGGTILKSTNGGSTWVPQTSNTIYGLNSIYFVDENIGYVVGNSNTLLKTTNAGNDWVALTTGTTSSFNSIVFTSASIGYIAGENGNIRKTTNSGANWLACNTGISTILTDLHFITDEIGYAVGLNGAIIKTTNSGTSWEIQNSNTTNSLFSVSFSNSNKGFAVGSDGIITKYLCNLLTTPELISPLNNSENIENNPTLLWQPVTQASSYTLEVSENINFSTTLINESNISTTGFQLNGLSYGTQYFWRVKAVNSLQTSDWSEVWNFTTEEQTIPGPVLISPLDNSINISTNANFEWQTLSGAASYTLQISTSALFDSLVINQSGIITSTQNIAVLDTNTQYFWRVKALVNGQSTYWSTVWSFISSCPIIDLSKNNILKNVAGNMIVYDTVYINNLGSIDLNFDIETVETTRGFNQPPPPEERNGSDSPEDYIGFLLRLAEMNTRSVPWLEVYPSSGVVAPNSSVALIIALNSEDLLNQIYSANILISSNDPVHNIELVAVNLSKGISNYITDDNENNYYQGIPDGDMNIYLDKRASIHPIEFNIFIDGEILINPQIVIYNFDIDESEGEVDQVYINNNYIGTLTGANQQWSSTILPINPSFLNTGSNNKNTIKILVDVQHISNWWATTIDWAQIIGDSSYSNNAYIRYVELSDTAYLPGETISITSEVDTYLESMEIRIETNLLDPTMTNIDGTTTITTINENEDDWIIEELLLPGNSVPGTYFVQVIVYDDQTNALNDITLVPFTCIGQAPPAPTVLKSPNIGDSCIVPTTFVWYETATAITYTLQISTTPNFSSIILNQSGISDTNFTTANLQFETEYFWRVRGHNGSLVGFWSNVWSFRTQTHYQVPWEFSSNTGNDATIIVPASIYPSFGYRQIADGDAIGLFYQRTPNDWRCGGYGIWNGDNLAIAVWGDDETTTIKDGFNVNEPYIYRVWDSQANTEYSATVTYSSGNPFYTVNGISILGNINILSNEILDIIMESGWNMISSNLIPFNNELYSIYESILPNINIVKNGQGQLFVPSWSLNQIGNWNITDGYYVNLFNSDVLSIDGIPVIPEITQMDLNSGWNLISYLRNSPMNIVNALQSLGNYLYLVKNNYGEFYIPSYDINTIGNMQPTKGYYVYMTNSNILYYPSNSAQKALAGDILTPIAKQLIPQFKNTGNSASLILQLDVIENGNEVGVYNLNDELIGSGAVNNGIAAITIWGDDEITTEIDGAINNELMTVKLLNNNTLQNISLFNIKEITNNLEQDNIFYGTNAIYTAKASFQTENELSFSISNIPNPVSNITTFEFSLTNEAEAEIEIYTLTGELVANIKNCNYTAGIHRVGFDASQLSNGVYNVILRSGNQRAMTTMVIEK